MKAMRERVGKEPRMARINADFADFGKWIDGERGARSQTVEK
jgi:hypothetical protein